MENPPKPFIWSSCFFLHWAAVFVFTQAVFFPPFLAFAGDSSWTLQEIASYHRGPEQVALFLRKKIVLISDRQLFGRDDYWQSPSETLRNGKGDCEDYALLAEALLLRQKIPAFVFSVYGSGGDAHTVCAFKENGRYNVINVDQLISYQAGSLEELAGKIHPRWEWAAVAKRAGHRGKALRRITP